MAAVDVNGVRIEYEGTGQGRPVVLLHGFPDSGRLWRIRCRPWPRPVSR